MGVAASSYRLITYYKKHPDYRGIRDSKCPTCSFIYHTRHGSGVNDSAIETEPAPSQLRFTRSKHKITNSVP